MLQISQTKLAAAFEAKGDGDPGTLPTKDTIHDAIKENFPELEPRQVHALNSLAEQREDGRWELENVQKWGFHTLQEIQDQNILMKSFKVVVGDE